MAKAKPAKPKPVSKAKAKGKTNAPEATLEKILGDVLYETPVPPGPANDPFPMSPACTIKGVEMLFVPGTNASTENFQGEPQAGGAKQVEGELLDAEHEGERPASPTPPEATEERQNDAGKIADPVEASSADSVELPLARVKPGESRKDCWERIRKEGRAAGLPRHVAYERANVETERLFSEELPAEQESETVRPTVGQTEQPSIPVVSAPVSDDQGVSGLSDLPSNWPELPANAQLQIEIAWVTANRLRVRDGTGVNLSKALSPAPSYSALSWLETSILFPAKFADISVKATADNDSEREFVKREKLAIEEIRSILSEMLEAED